MIICAPLTIWTESLAMTLYCSFQRPQTATYARQRVFQTLNGSGQSTIGVTTPLKLGTDIPDIRAVVHVEALSTLQEFDLKSNRAVRNGQKNVSILYFLADFAQDIERLCREFYIQSLQKRHSA